MDRWPDGSRKSPAKQSGGGIGDDGFGKVYGVTREEIEAVRRLARRYCLSIRDYILILDMLSIP